MKDLKAVSNQAIQSQIFTHARQSKLLIWTEVERGGCIQSSGQLELRSDGSGTWTCTTKSGNPFPGDVWHTDFAVRDRNGLTLFGAGPFYSPRMCAGHDGRDHRWSAPFTFSADLFDGIHAAAQNCGILPPVAAINVSTTGPVRRQQVVAGELWHRTKMALDLRAFA